MARFSGSVKFNLIAITIFLCIPRAGGGQTQGERSWNPLFPLPCEGTDSDTTVGRYSNDIWWEYDCSGGSRNGRAVGRTAEHVVVYDGYFRNGVPVAPTRKWFPSGARRSETLPFKEHGTREQTWYPTGQPETFSLHDSMGKIVYGVHFSEAGGKVMEMCTAPKYVPADVGRLKDLRHEKITAEIIDEADRHIIGKVGEGYFRKYYRFLRQKSEFRIEGEYGEYLLRYEYTPLHKISPGTVISLRVARPASRPPEGFVGVVSNGAILEPAITREKAIDLICSSADFYPNPNSVSARLLTPFLDGSPQAWTWEVTFPDPDAKRDSIQVFSVDAVSGDVEVTTLPRGFSSY